MRDFGVKTGGVLKVTARRVDTRWGSVSPLKSVVVEQKGLTLDVGPPLGVRLRMGSVTSYSQIHEIVRTAPTTFHELPMNGTTSD